jgi:uncharacterized protein YyaL (SSP411 family)
MISALAQAWQVLGDEQDLASARRAALYVLERMRQPDGRLYATARGGKPTSTPISTTTPS